MICMEVFVLRMICLQQMMFQWFHERKIVYVWTGTKQLKMSLLYYITIIYNLFL